MRRSAEIGILPLAVDAGVAVCAVLLLASAGFAQPGGDRAFATAAPLRGAQGSKLSEKVADDLERGQDQALSQPATLVPVFEQLLRLDAGRRDSSLHILHFGDSHSAADDWTGTLRQLLQERFGDGGSGFSLAGHPYRSYRRFDARGGGTAGWHAAGLHSPAKGGYYGLGGVSISTRDPGQSVFVAADCDYLEIHYLQQPGGGDLALYDDDQLVEKFSTAGAEGPGVFPFHTTPGSHRFTLKTLTSRPVQLFGWVADRTAGVTYESLGIDGVEASIMLRWNEEMFATYLGRRDPGLVVLAYGTNEALDRSWTAAKYQAMFASLLQRIRRAAPASSILVIGPPDCWSRQNGTWQPMPGLDTIIEAQEAACRQDGCAFWDTRKRMGGPGAMRDWIRAGLGQPDYVHFTPAGYHRLGEALFADMMRLYAKFQRIRLEILDTGLAAAAK